MRLDQRRHQRLRRREQHRVALPDRLAPERDREMRLPDPGRTEHQERIAVRHPPRRRQLPHLAPVDAGLGLEVEVRQLPHHREVRDLERHLNAALVLAADLPLDEHRQRLPQRQLLLRRLVEQVVELVADRGQLQPRQPAEKRLMVHGHQKLPPATAAYSSSGRSSSGFGRTASVSAGRGPPTTPTRWARSVTRAWRPGCSTCSATTLGPW